MHVLDSPRAGGSAPRTPDAPLAPDTLLARARVLCASGRPQAARPLLAAARRLGAAPDEIDLLDADLLLRDGRLREALRLLDAALARSPAMFELREARARARLLSDDRVGAASDAAEALLLRPADAAAKATLGIAMGELGHLQDARACLAEAVRAEPANPGFRVALAHTLDRSPDAAQATLDEGLALAPRALMLWTAAAHRALALGAFERALRICLAARAAGITDACLIGMQGHALSCLGRHDEASDAYEQALQLAPEDSYVRHLVAASGRRPAEARAPRDYVRVVFDGYADRFDAHLVSLGYRVPGLLRAAVLEHAAPGAASRLGPALGPALGPVLDLGCGTGLAALAMSDLPLGPWHGVDLSCAMLRHARDKGLYKALESGALPEALETRPEQATQARSGQAKAAGEGVASTRYALAVAADMLCYLGDLAPLLRAVHARLLPDGLLVASLEAMPADHAGRGWMLQANGRYAHAPGHVAELAARAGFDVLALRPEFLRAEHGGPVAGMIAVLRRPA